MASTRPTVTIRGAASPVAARGDRAPGPLPTRDRRPGLLAAALALILGCAAAGGFLFVSAGQKTPVVVMARDVPAGHVIERADLSTVAVAGAITAVSAVNLDAMVGKTATVGLLRGTLLQRSMVTNRSVLSGGLAAVGVAAKPGQVPADGLAPGASVTLLKVPAAGSASSDESQAEILVARAEVFSSHPDPAQAGGTLVTVLVPEDEVAAVAAAGGTGQVALVEVAPK